MEVELKHTSAIYRIAQHGDFDGTTDLTNGCSFIWSFVLGIVFLCSWAALGTAVFIGAIEVPINLWLTFMYDYNVIATNFSLFGVAGWCIFLFGLFAFVYSKTMDYNHELKLKKQDSVLIKVIAAISNKACFKVKIV